MAAKLAKKILSLRKKNFVYLALKKKEFTSLHINFASFNKAVY